ncbi:protein disulfide isomerase [Vararia minispora EC-137]|uniref:Protein disulfide isomerase n=1 Tax=Vararia minispora EC-137 TaxID=1314806 RepID=A0ACB8QD40_9AGAM|nr:protein disulfide isomerase [Vararia minispora EC-137]
MKFAASFWSLSLLAGAFASNVLDLSAQSDFEATIGKGKPGLVEFFAPWCGHCKNLAPVYEQLADAFSHQKEKVIVAKVDADGEGRPLGQKYDVTGFPTLKWFDANGEAEAYSGARDLDALADFITSKTGLKSKIKPPPPTAVKVLDASTFDEVIKDPTHDSIVAFTAPWCGHCKRLKPIYEEVAKDFVLESNCVVANVDGDAEKNRDLAMTYSISSFPTIKFFPKGGEPIDYDGPRTEEAFVEYLNEKCGTHRAVGGTLNDRAGRLPALDELASQFFIAAASERDTIYKSAAGIASELGGASKHYLRAMEKVLNGTEDYFAKESKRLSNILTKRTLSLEKLDEIKLKANVLAAFAEKKVGEAAEKVKEALAHEEL